MDKMFDDFNKTVESLLKDYENISAKRKLIQKKVRELETDTNVHLARLMNNIRLLGLGDPDDLQTVKDKASVLVQQTESQAQNVRQRADEAKMESVSLKARIANLKDEITRLMGENSLLKKQLLEEPNLPLVLKLLKS